MMVAADPKSDKAVDADKIDNANSADNSDKANSVGDRRGRSLNRWRKQRPFGAGLSMILGGAVILTPAYLTFDVQGLLISISSLSGVSTLLIGVLLIVCGLLTWRGGDTRILTGVTSLILAIVALPTSNFGGFILGTMLALVGGALALSWSPDEKPVANGPGAPGGSEVAEPGSGTGRAEGKGPSAAGSSAAALIIALAMVGAIAAPPMFAPPVASAAPAPWPIPALPVPWAPQEQAPPAIAPPALSPLPDTGTIPSPSELLPGLPGTGTEPDGDAGGFGLGDPPESLPGELNVSDSMEIITADSVRLLGNVRLSETAVTIPSGEVVQAIRLDADRVELDNLGLQAEGVDVGLSTAPGTMSTLTGNFHIIVRSLTVTPAASAGELIPITIDARWIDDAVLESLASHSLGLPDQITDELILRDVSLESFMVRSDRLQLPTSARIG